MQDTKKAATTTAGATTMGKTILKVVLSIALGLVTGAQLTGCSRESGQTLPAAAPAAPPTAAVAAAPAAIPTQMASAERPSAVAASVPVADAAAAPTTPGPRAALAAAPAASSAPTLVAATPVAFDPATVAPGSGTVGAWPYFGILDGYERMTAKNRPGDSTRDFQKDVAFDRYEFFDGEKFVPVEGRRITFKALGKGASVYQAMKNYETVVKSLGGTTVFEGKAQIVKDRKLKFEGGGHRGRNIWEGDVMGVYFLRTADNKEVWVEVYKSPWNDNNNDDYWLTVVDKKALEVTLKALPATEMKKALDANGRVALYINFDTDKSLMKPESAPAVAEIVKLLTADPALKLTVEGHTDNAGTPERNQKLSEARAGAVVGALMGQGIAYDRLQPLGLGQSKPLMDNATDAGKAKNRRVELVKR